MAVHETMDATKAEIEIDTTYFLPSRTHAQQDYMHAVLVWISSLTFVRTVNEHKN